MKSSDARTSIGYVYFLRAEETGLTKIGVTRRLETRIAGLQTASPCVLTLIDSIQKQTWNQARGLEQRLHRHLEQYRIKGEWFKVEPAVLVEAIKEAKSVSSLEEYNTPFTRLSVEEKIAQENEWEAAGCIAFHEKVKLKDFPHVGKKYSNIWYRAKGAWQRGWENAKMGKYLKAEHRTWLSR